MAKIEVIKAGDYEAIYINDLLFSEGEINQIQEGQERVKYFINLADEYGIDIREINFRYIEDDIWETVGEEFPNRLSDLVWKEKQCL